jgi:hypothetical protein
MKKFLIASIAAAVALTSCVGLLAACDKDDDSSSVVSGNTGSGSTNTTDSSTGSGSGSGSTTFTPSTEISMEGTVYYTGNQTVIFQISTNEDTTFKSTISTSDITFSGALAGKTITSVTYNNSYKVTVLLDGTVTASESQLEDFNGTITLGASAMSNNKSYTVNTEVDFHPVIEAHGRISTNKASDGTNQYIYYTTLQLPYGSINQEAIENDNKLKLEYLTFTNATPNAKIASFKINANGRILITITGFEITAEKGPYPIVKMDASVTSLNIELTIDVGLETAFDIDE